MTINHVTIVGNLTADVKKGNAGQTPFIEFSIATNEWRKTVDGKGEEIANFFDCAMYGDRAKSLSTILHKGMKVAISGKLVQRRWQTKEGENRSKVSIVVYDVEIMQSKQDFNAENDIPW